MFDWEQMRRDAEKYELQKRLDEWTAWAQSHDHAHDLKIVQIAARRPDARRPPHHKRKALILGLLLLALLTLI